MGGISECKKKLSEIQYGFIFHQRTFPVYRKIKEIIDNKTYGNIKRVNWVITDWYRPDAYYESGKWRATWKYDGGGTCLTSVLIILIYCHGYVEILQMLPDFAAKASIIR